MTELDLSLSASALRLAELQSDEVAEGLEGSILEILQGLGPKYLAEGQRTIHTAIDRLVLNRAIATVLDMNWSEELRTYFVEFLGTELGREYLRTQAVISLDVQRAIHRMLPDFLQKVIRTVNHKEE